MFHLLGHHVGATARTSNRHLVHDYEELRGWDAGENRLPLQPRGDALIYRLDRPALLAHLAALQAEAAANLAALNPSAAPADLNDRFTGWASAR
ncbi:hypothetical protein ACIBCL_07920 [Micromonospora zamorensis]|uniref:hypothetical protein n=1 Tax=Micromonospora zamorensis TaxID=709883 RepID=UPI0037A2BD58